MTISAAVGIAVGGNINSNRQVNSRRVHDAMAAAVQSCRENGVDNPKLVKRAMMAARQKAKRAISEEVKNDPYPVYR